MDWNTLIALASFIGGMVASAITFLKWYGSSQKKAYAAERDFQHLKNNYLQLSQGIAEVHEEIQEVKINQQQTNANLMRLESFLIRTNNL